MRPPNQAACLADRHSTGNHPSLLASITVRTDTATEGALPKQSTKHLWCKGPPLTYFEGMAGAEGEEVIEDDLANTALKKRKRTLVTVVIVVLVAAVAGLGFALTQKNHTASASAVRATTTTTTISIPTTPTSTTVPTTYPPKSPCSSRSACISDTPCTASALADAFQSTGAAANGGSIPTDVVPTGSPLCVTTTGDGPFAFLNFNSPSVGSVSAVFNTQGWDGLPWMHRFVGGAGDRDRLLVR